MRKIVVIVTLFCLFLIEGCSSKTSNDIANTLSNNVKVQFSYHYIVDTRPPLAYLYFEAISSSQSVEFSKDYSISKGTYKMKWKRQGTYGYLMGEQNSIVTIDKDTKITIALDSNLNDIVKLETLSVF